uniref:Sperm associated antigen 1 n=1 Tax=Canis lupus dingo TaxID=286419 RepID=A0A8C0JIS1_CANLU
MGNIQKKLTGEGEAAAAAAASGRRGARRGGAGGRGPARTSGAERGRRRPRRRAVPTGTRAAGGAPGTLRPPPPPPPPRPPPPPPRRPRRARPRGLEEPGQRAVQKRPVRRGGPQVLGGDRAAGACRWASGASGASGALGPGAAARVTGARVRATFVAGLRGAGPRVALRDFNRVQLNVTLGSGSADDLSVLYANRAACYLKEGNCGGCIQDCNRALELHPFSVKPLLRRAMAYETLEQYQKAYVDYKTVLQIDCKIQLANDSINRITRILMNLDGPSWREKLSPIPAVPTSAHLRAWQLAVEPPPNQVGDSCSRPQPGITDEKMFKNLKEEGNQCVKDKNYKDALSKYSECLTINNKECAIYTNRALCYLKLCQFEEAKQDCDRALQIDNGNVKACYRRALAHKGLKVRKSTSQIGKLMVIWALNGLVISVKL